MPSKREGRAVGKQKSAMARWLKTVRSMYGLTQEDLAAYLGKTRGAVSMYEADLQAIPAHDVATIKSTFSDAPTPPTSSSEMVIKGTVSEDGVYARIPYAGVVPASGTWGDPLSANEDRDVDPELAGIGRFMCSVVGDSCYPALQQGDLVVFDTTKIPAQGQIVLAERSSDKGCTVKELDYIQGRLALMPINKKYKEIGDEDGFQVTAVLIGVMAKPEGPKESWIHPPGLRADYLTRKRESKDNS